MVTQGEKTGLYLSGQPVPIENCNIILTQPKIKDIVIFGEDDFLVVLNFIINIRSLVQQSVEGNSQLDILSDFQILMTLIEEDDDLEEELWNFLNFIFPTYEIEIDEDSFKFFLNEEEKENNIITGIVNVYNFEHFRSALNDVLNVSMDDDKIEYNPANEAANQIAEKLKKGRERAAKAKGESGPQSLFGRYVSILSIGMQMDINIFFNYTPFQLYDSFQRYFDKVNHDVYTKVSTTPLMDVSAMKTPKDWARNLYQ